VPLGSPARSLALRDPANRVPQSDGVLMAHCVGASLPAFSRGLSLAEQADDATARPFVANLPVAEALAREQMSPADRAHRHRALILGLGPDGDYVS
jgi:hypothetical protein